MTYNFKPCLRASVVNALSLSPAKSVSFFQRRASAIEKRAPVTATQGTRRDAAASLTPPLSRVVTNVERPPPRPSYVPAETARHSP
jgi:hypothetical protein